MTTTDREQIEQAIAALEAQRAVLGNAVVDAAIGPMRKELAALAPAEPEQQRKLVTLLFCDVAGSTTMVRDLDPEDNLAIMDAGLKRLAAHVGELGGRVTRYMGDGFKALFGHPAARENDAEMAIRAGLAILQEAQAYASEVEQRFGVKDFTVRVGINTGLVIIGGEVEGEDAVVGAAVNLAARMESAAEPGTLLISHDTCQHVRGVFDLQPLAPVTAKGFEQPVPVYRVLAANERSFRTRRRGIEGIETHMIGREAELAAMQDAYVAAAEDGERRAITLVGDAGLGKSRLLYEFENWLDLQSVQSHYYRGRARFEMRGQAYGLIRDIFALRFQIHDDDPAQGVRRKFVAGFQEMSGMDETGEMKAQIVGQIMGFDFRDSLHVRAILDDPQQLHNRALVYLVDYFRSASLSLPCIILLEDLHWADDSSLDALLRLTQAMENRPFLVIGAARPELYQRRPHWLEGYTFHQRLNLRPLSNRESRRLVEEVLQKVDDIPNALRDLVVGNAEGNPFYVEELIKMLVEEGVIIKAEPRWRVVLQRLENVRVPPTLTGVLQARIDSLPGEERAVLQQASVVGRVFWDTVVNFINREVSGEAQETRIREGLSALHSKEMVFQRDLSSFSGTGEYIFKNALLRDVTYETVLKRLRRAYHAQAAAWLVQVSHSQGRADEYASLIADHYDHADKGSEARHWHLRAGRQAAARHGHTEAVRHLGRALALTPNEDVASRVQILLEIEVEHHLLGEREAQIQDLDMLQTLTSEHGSSAEQAEVALLRARMHEATGDFDAASAAAHEAIALARINGDQGQEALGQLQLGLVLRGQGDMGAANDHLVLALALAQTSERLDLVAPIQYQLGLLAVKRSDHAAAESYYQQSLATSRAIGDRFYEGMSLTGLGHVSWATSDYNAARRYYEQSLVIARETGHRREEAWGLASLGWNAADQGHYARAQEHFQKALPLAREIRERYLEGIILNNLGLVSAACADYVRASDYFAQAHAIDREIGSRDSELFALTGWGDALAGEGRITEAEMMLQEAVSLRRELGNEPFVMESLAVLAGIYLTAGNTNEAIIPVNEILMYLNHGGSFNGTEYRLRNYLICYQVLNAIDDPRAIEVLRDAHAHLQEHAARIPDDETRSSFLQAVPWHRAIIAAWEEKSSSDTTA